MDDQLDGVLNSLLEADEVEKKATKKAKKAAQKKPPETMEEAFDRVLGMKLKEDERTIVREVQRLLEHHMVQRISDKKLSKKEVFDIWKQYQLKKREEKKQYVVDTRPENFWIIQDSATLQLLRQMLETEPLTSWDTETEGLDIFNHKVVGYSVYLPNHDIAAYVPFAHTTGQAQVTPEEALELAKWYLENLENKTCWHNYKYDAHVLLNMGIECAPPFWDTQVVSKLLNDNERSHRLKDLYAQYIDKGEHEAVMFEDLFDDFIIYDKDVILSGIYAAGDAHKTHKLMEFQKPYIDSRDNLKTVWYEIEQHLLQVDLAMERTGFRIDLDRMGELGDQFEPILTKAESELLTAFQINEEFVAHMADALGKTVREVGAFNIQSNQHLGYLIYDVLGVDPEIGKRFKKAARSTAADVVDAICKEVAELTPLLKYRKLLKMVTTYIRKIPLAIEPSTGLLHSRFNNLSGDDGSGTATGRYSSSEFVTGKNSATGDHGKGTNLQNIPSKKEGKQIRMCFIPDKEWMFVAADLSQIEPRIISVILAEKYGDKAMQELYMQGVDLYTTMAMQTFGLPRENCVDGGIADIGYGTFEPRKLMKQGVLAFLYGQSPRSFARTMKVSEETAEVFFEGMTTAFHGLKPFREDTIKSLLTVGPLAHVETLFGRKRRFPAYRKDYVELQKLNKIPRNKISVEDKARRNELWRKCASVERQAINTIIQGSAADVLKQIMISMYRWTKNHGYKLHASIHDELIISVPLKELSLALVQKVDEIMTKTVTFSTPLKSDVVIMPRWMEDYKAFREWDFEANRPTEDAIHSRLHPEDGRAPEPCSYSLAV